MSPRRWPRVDPDRLFAVSIVTFCAVYSAVYVCCLALLHIVGGA
ncbi:hypothetical protein [Microbacterium sp. ZXX196]|nr:hypothetical protein [Microbacterium sp. ZXX196]